MSEKISPTVENVSSGSDLEAIKVALLGLKQSSDRHVTEEKFFNYLLAVIGIVIALLSAFTALIFFMFQWQLNNHVQIVALEVQRQLQEQFDGVERAGLESEERINDKLERVQARIGDAEAKLTDLIQLNLDSGIDEDQSPIDEGRMPELEPDPNLLASNESLDIVEIAANSGEFNTLASALTAAGLVETLKGDGPFTVFAPTDAAFAALPAGTVEDLLKPENSEVLISIMNSLIVPGKVYVGDGAKAITLKTASGSTLELTTGENPSVSGAKIVDSDVQGSNGVIQVIDTVILPPM